MPPTRSLYLKIGLVLCYLSLLVYGSLLIANACLFIHEQYGIAVPTALIAPVVVLSIVQTDRDLTRAASLAVGFAVGLLTAGAFFWMRYAYYTESRLTIPALTVVALSALALIALGWQVKGRSRSASRLAFVYTAAVITFGQGIPDRDPMRPNALAAARRLEQVGTQMRGHAAANGHSSLSLGNIAPDSTSLLGYSVIYERAADDQALLFRLFAVPDHYRVTGCHAFYTDGTGRFTYTRQPRRAEASDLSWH